MEMPMQHLHRLVLTGALWSALGLLGCASANAPIEPQGESAERGQRPGSDSGRTVVTDRCARTTGDACETDAECATGGCGGELCYASAAHDEPPLTTCDCQAPQASCGCVAGTCAWYQ
jgi:hypothetical protein